MTRLVWWFTTSSSTWWFSNVLNCQTAFGAFSANTHRDPTSELSPRESGAKSHRDWVNPTPDIRKHPWLISHHLPVLVIFQLNSHSTPQMVPHSPHFARCVLLLPKTSHRMWPTQQKTQGHSSVLGRLGRGSQLWMLLAGWALGPSPLKNDGLKVSWDDDIPNWMEK